MTIASKKHDKKGTEPSSVPFFHILLTGLLRLIKSHDDPPVGIGTHRVSSHTRHILQRGMDNVPLVSVHRLQRHIPPVLDCPGGLLPGQPLEALLPLEPVVLRVHMDPDPLLAALVDGVIGQLLDGVQGLAPASDKRPQLLAFQNDLVAS